VSKILDKEVKELSKLDSREDELTAELKTVRAKRAAIEEKLLAELQSENLITIKTVYGRVWLHPYTYPIVDDWEKVYGYVAKHKAFDLLHRRISLAAVQERVESGRSVPGLKLETATKLEYRRK
jgi:hypothetical protein